MQKRIEFWNDNYRALQQSDSIAVPFEKHIGLFKGKDILEIGPGEGRQFDIAIKLARLYAVADISKVVLDQYTCRKFLITSYKDRFDAQFDLIHFWYVLHHVLREELKDFVDFLWVHIKRDGLVLFNTPVLEYGEDNYKNDGIMTTSFTIDEVEKAFNKRFSIITKDNSLYERSNGWIVVAQRRRIWVHR